MNKNEKIGIFDSGIGGATVLKEIINTMPNESFNYYSDSINNPYGDKNYKKIMEICDNIVKRLIVDKSKAIVIACNTASAVAVNYLRNKYPEQIIIAIEPAYKMVYDYAYDNNTLVMATKGTIESEKFHALYKKYDNNKTALLECKGLADLIEEGNKEKVKEYLNKNLNQYRGKVKNVVLGCTHYPLIQDEIKDVLGDVEFFNGAPNLARHLKKVLEQNDLLNDSNIKGEIDFFDSSNSKIKKERFFNYINY